MLNGESSIFDQNDLVDKHIFIGGNNTLII